MDTEYRQISESDLPDGLRWDVSGRDAGQIVEVAYADYHAGAGPADCTARYRRTTDFSVGPRARRYSKRCPVRAEGIPEPLPRRVLRRAHDGCPLRPATSAEVAESLAASQVYGGAGVIWAMDVRCYVD